jgi:hypothetical protein
VDLVLGAEATRGPIGSETGKRWVATAHKDTASRSIATAFVDPKDHPRPALPGPQSLSVAAAAASTCHTARATSSSNVIADRPA